MFPLSYFLSVDNPSRCFADYLRRCFPLRNSKLLAQHHRLETRIARLRAKILDSVSQRAALESEMSRRGLPSTPNGKE
jgi:hypothetical protein